MSQIAISNIAWDSNEHEQVLELLREQGVTQIEVAPTKLWPDWIGATAESASHQRSVFESQGFSVPSFQAIFYGKPELKLFSTETARELALEHIGLVAQLANSLGARKLVFGSPGNRDRLDLSEAEALAISVEFFAQAAKICCNEDVIFCLEPNPTAYGCNFATNVLEADRIVRAVNDANFQLIIDTACLFLANDDCVAAIAATRDTIAHFHVSEPQLADFSNPQINHAAIGSALAETGYAGTITIEMRRSDRPLDSIREATRRVLEWYGS